MAGLLLLFCQQYYTPKLQGDTNQTLTLTAKPKDNPQEREQDIEGAFTTSPNANKDEIHVTKPEGVPGYSAGVYDDPINDCAILVIGQKKGPVKVDVEGREGIGAIYYVVVGTPPGAGAGGTGTEKNLLWADAKDVEIAGALVAKDKNYGTATADCDDSVTTNPMICLSASTSDGKVDVEFYLKANAGTYDWTIKEGTTLKGSGTLVSTNSYKATKLDLDIGTYVLEVTKQGDNNFKRVISIVSGQIKRKEDGGAAYKALTEALTQGVTAGHTLKHKDALPGQKMDLKVDFTPPTGVTIAEYAWIFDGVTFKDYVANQTTGTLTTLASGDLDDQAVAYYWTSTGVQKARCRLTLSNGDSIILSSEFNIAKPTVTFTSTIITPRLWPDDTPDHVTLWNGTRDGIEFKGKVKISQEFTSGQWCFVQLICASRYRTHAGTPPVPYAMKSNGVFMLDTHFPYPIYTINDTKTVISTDENNLQEPVDSPGHGYFAEMVEVSVNNERYVATVLFKPPGTNSRYVPMKEIPWSWSITARLNNGVWGVVANTAKSSTLAEGRDTTMHPTWAKNVKDCPGEEEIKNE